MPRRVLILGGTRYFGKRLVERLLATGDSVTIATRGSAVDTFGNRVGRLRIERDSLESLRTEITGTWDLVYDQICYSPSAAIFACKVFDGRVGRYVHTSTQSIYTNAGLLKEEDFEPRSYPIRLGHRADFEYGEGKRLAEAVFFQRAGFPVAAMRIPIVLGIDDYTGRLEFHIDRVRSGSPIYLSNTGAEACFIDSDEAARFLFWLGEKDEVREPINACSTGRIGIMELIHLVENAVDRRAIVAKSGRPEDHSPFVDDSASYMDNSRALSLGFQFRQLNDWLPALVRERARS